MTTYAVATKSSEIGTPYFAMAASIVTTVTFDQDITTVEIISDGTAAIWYTFDGTTPSAGGARSYYLPAAPCVDRREPQTGGATTIKLISTGTPSVRIQVA